jgi:glyoxylase-like metal-dependent hydrolase (beta-lactamase superfamily II)
LGFLVGQDLFSGDTLFPGGPGHTNSAAELTQLARTIREKLFTLPDDTTVYPGHGVETTIGREEESSREFMRRVEAGVELWGDLTWDSG